MTASGGCDGLASGGRPCPGSNKDPDAEMGSLGELLDCLEGIADKEERISLGRVADALGRRTFAPLLIVSGLVILAPLIGDVPGVPAVMGLLTLLVAGQLILAREHLWLPGWLSRRAVDRRKVRKAVGWSRHVARPLDRWTRPRLGWLFKGPGLRLISAACVMVALSTPVLEFIPFSANLAGLALTCFGVSLLVRDGALAVLALGACAGIVGLLATQLS